MCNTGYFSGTASKILKLNRKMEINRPVADPPASAGLHRKCFKNPCVLCSAVAYCCGAVVLCAIAALLGRFLPRLGPLVHSSGPFFLSSSLSGAQGASFDVRLHVQESITAILRMDSLTCSRTSKGAQGRASRNNKEWIRAPTPRPPGMGRGRRAEPAPARRRALRNRQPPAQSAVSVHAAARPYRSRG
jgi:hypothetical protein